MLYIKIHTYIYIYIYIYVDEELAFFSFLAVPFSYHPFIL